MTAASIDSMKAERELSHSWMDSFAKKSVLGLFKQLKLGCLVIEDGDEVYRFGEPNPGVEVTAHITVRHPSAWRIFLFKGSTGSGEAYMLGAWTTPDLLKVVRLFCRNIEKLNEMDGSRTILSRISDKIFHVLNMNTLSGSKKNISAHYDLGNDFFKLFLDETLMYSSAVYGHDSMTLDEASRHKLDVICKKLRLNENDHLIEIGTGWGGMAIHAAKYYGCKVTTTTISQKQYEFAKEAVAKAGLEDKVTLLLEDYRDLKGKYTKLVSVEMIEAVGHKNYKEYFSICSQLLDEDGLMCIQAITIADQRYKQAINSVDFIQRYIFPGGSLPCNEVILSNVAKYTNMQLVHLEDIGQDYARTLESWRSRFMSKLHLVKGQGFDDVFCRMWEFYLCYCEGGFLERSINTAHFVLAKPMAFNVKPLS